MESAVGPLWCRTRPAGRGTVAVDKIGLVPQHPLPFRGLLQKVMPGDRVVVRRLEAAILHRAADRLMRIADQSAVPGETGDDREITLGDAECHIDPRRLAPFGDHPAIA